MTYQQKNITASLVSFSLILGFYLLRVFQLVQNETFTSANVFRLWGIVVALAVFATIAATILTHIVSAIVQAIRAGDENPEVEDLEDERDQLIDLKGTKVAYSVSSLGALLAMLSFVLGQSPLVMFSLLVFFSLLAQIIGDIARLRLYQRGF